MVSNVVPLDRMLLECLWPRCRRDPVGIQIPLCDSHFAYLGERYINERSIWGAASLRERNGGISEAEREAHFRSRQRAEEREKALRGQVVVYYVRIGDHIKIGFTTNMKLRLSALRIDPDAVLATEPGGRTLEAERHKQFAAERVSRREDFNPSRRLLDHIGKVRQEHGPPVVTGYPTN